MQRKIDNFFGGKRKQRPGTEGEDEGDSKEDTMPKKRACKLTPPAAALAAAAEVMDVNVHESWKPVLYAELAKPYFGRLVQFLRSERATKPIFPPKANVLEALKLCPLSNVKVVILGQDPYHGPGQAHGLAFSVLPGVTPPPSLRNMLKEAASDVGTTKPNHGYLVHWARQGVLLLNTVLTVQQAKAHSHAKKGWESFTDELIRAVSTECSGVVFLLWGRPAQSKAKLITKAKHHILQAAHPSPLSASRGFMGCKHFSKANALLRDAGVQPIDWQLPENAVVEMDVEGETEEEAKQAADASEAAEEAGEGEVAEAGEEDPDDADRAGGEEKESG
eukprot:CAMPEP_0196782726 /NCGR_PEP_ID=MMETSP1104-20130614/11956_1 /TAXON_ID=33652 /ORGANISM="Cafeteria sp., Strain Caron Lab Isolate" /LENGTH=333 /DNA_ID=CAMNT_0042152969 /DNA_START=1 /DNA_END=998 /DNA_ORIENTATION=+